MTTEVSAGIVSKGKSVLMQYDDSTETWDVPSKSCEKGELSSDAAKRAIKEFTDSEIDSIRYRNKMKKKYQEKEEEVTIQSFDIELVEEPERGEWVKAESMDEKNLSGTAAHIKSKIKDKIS